MQMAAPELLNFSNESKNTLEMYGVNSEDEDTRQYATNCLLARRLVERGVRFILMMTAYRHFRRTKVPSTKAAILAVQL